MTENSPDLQSSIRLAIEAAEAANDATQEIEGLRAETRNATEQLQHSTSRMWPVVLGMVIGTGVCVVGAGMIYFRTLADLEIARKTQIEALALFSERVEQLDTTLSELQGMAGTVEAAASKTEAGFGAVEESLENLRGDLSDQLQRTSETASGMSAQFGSKMLEAVAAEHAETREAIISGASDLQLALTRMLADGLPPDREASPSAPSTAQERPAPRPQSAPARAPVRPRPAPNPFSYP